MIPFGVPASQWVETTGDTVAIAASPLRVVRVSDGVFAISIDGSKAASVVDHAEGVVLVTDSTLSGAGILAAKGGTGIIF